MTVFVHAIEIISFKFLFVERLGPASTLNEFYRMIRTGVAGYVRGNSHQ